MMPRSRRCPFAAIVLAAALVVFAPAQTRAGVSFSLAASVGAAAGTASELVFSYPYGRKFKISELTWDLQDVVVGGVHGTLDFGRRYRLSLGVSSALVKGAGMMVDRDWVYPENVSASLEPTAENWTAESRHPDTSLDQMTFADLNLGFLVLQAGPFSLRGLAGYKYDVWDWSARGGTGVYSLNGGFRDTRLTFPAGDLVITYEQRYSIPYLGIGANWTRTTLQVEARLLVSTMVSATDSDYHVYKDLLFEGDFSGGRYLGFGLNASWAFAPHWSAVFAVEYQSIPEMTGDVLVISDAGRGLYREGGGVAMSATVIELRAEHRF